MRYCSEFEQCAFEEVLIGISLLHRLRPIRYYNNINMDTPSSNKELTMITSKENS